MVELTLVIAKVVLSLKEAEELQYKMTVKFLL